LVRSTTLPPAACVIRRQTDDAKPQGQLSRVSLAFDPRLSFDGRMIKTGALLMLVIAAGLAPPPAAAQNVTVGGMARSYSASFFMRTVCPKFIRVNVAFAQRYGGDILDIGSTTFGKPEMKDAVAKEIERRRNEVAATGESAWCSYQRASMIGDGLNELFR
jgi:hypothetical protein